MAYCKYCGSALENNAKYCSNCGSTVKASSQENSSNSQSNSSSTVYTETSYNPYHSAESIIGAAVGAGIATSLLHELFRPRRRHAPPPPPMGPRHMGPMGPRPARPRPGGMSGRPGGRPSGHGPRW